MMGLTPKQAKAKAFIKQHIATRGYAPTVDEICLGLDLKWKSQASGMLRTLEERGHIRREPRRWRAIEVIEVEVAA